MSYSPERWRVLEELYRGAVERPEGGRAAFLKEACPDEDLRREVESLLRFEHKGETLLQQSPWATSPGMAPGMRLGPYEVESRLGAGGMGEVWKARDTRLGRSVAVKVSKTEFSERFEREARAVATLNHPNIATLYDVGPNYFVMEYVDGKSLQEVIPRKGLSVGESLKYATQIADALAAAHAAGIVHRDLKPGNVMITSSGQVKVVDFGLARMEGAPNADGHASLQTVEGTIAGTVAYMSPEQTQGQAMDARSDVFSFGALFYEMLAGARAFRGDSTAATLAEILTKEPPPIENLPGDVEKLLNRCLRKEPGRRAQSMADVKAALLDLKEDSDSGRLYEALPTPRRGSPGWPRFGLWAAAGAAVLALAGLSVWLTHYASPAPPQTIVRLTTYPGSELYPSFSPDGNQVAFSWDGEQQENFDIYIQQVGGAAPVRLTTDPARDSYPAWSPDGRTIAFTRFLTGSQAVILIPSIGGPERKLLEITGSSVAWSSDSKWLAFADGNPGSLFLYSVTTGERKRLTTAPAESQRDDFPVFSQDGRRLAFVRTMTPSARNIYALSLGDAFQPVAQPVKLSKPGGFSRPAWTTDGRDLVFSENDNSIVDNLWRSKAAAGAEPRLVVSDGGIAPAISPQGTRLAFAREITDNNIWRASTHDGSGGSDPVRLIASTRSDQVGRYSPDGRQIAFVSDRTGQSEIWIANADGTNQIQLTSLENAGAPSWSPDGQKIVFSSPISGSPQVYAISLGGGKPLQITSAATGCTIPRYSRDGKWIYCASRQTGRFEVWKIASQGGAPVQVTRNGGYAAEESLDGAWLYFTRDDSSRGLLMKMPSGGGPERQVVSEIARRAFAPASQGVYFIQHDSARSASIRFLNEETGAVRVLQVLTKPLWSFLSVSPDEQFVLWTQADQFGSDLMMIENFR
jgi:eukaryotic-like serine/threonine-protein kinase